MKTETHEIKKTARHAEIRQGYFQIADALPALAHELEMADLELHGDNEERGPLLDDHLIVCEMMELAKKLSFVPHI